MYRRSVDGDGSIVSQKTHPPPHPARIHRLFGALGILGRGKINAWLPRSARARDFVNFRGGSSCIARARLARAGLTVYPPSRTLELLAFDEYCRFDTSAFF